MAEGPRAPRSLGGTIHDDHPHDIVTAAEVVKYSSNIGAGKLALELGPDRLLPVLHGFGFGQQLGIEVHGERAGRVRSADSIRPVELVTTAYGQGVSSTTLQLAIATATIANDGVRMQPRLVRRVEDPWGDPAHLTEPRAAERGLSPATARLVTDAMVSVFDDDGTGTRARVPGYRAAGKTGTAWKVVGGRYTNARISSFIGFVPADDPAIAIAIVVDEPSVGSRYGGVVAGPAFSSIAAESLPHLGVDPDPDLVEHDADRDAPTQLAEPAPLEARWSGRGWELPDLTGRSLRDALVGLQGLGLRIELAGAGRVAGQEPAPGVSVAPGSTVQLSLR